MLLPCSRSGSCAFSDLTPERGSTAVCRVRCKAVRSRCAVRGFRRATNGSRRARHVVRWVLSAADGLRHRVPCVVRVLLRRLQNGAHAHFAGNLQPCIMSVCTGTGLAPPNFRPSSAELVLSQTWRVLAGRNVGILTRPVSALVFIALLCLLHFPQHNSGCGVAWDGCG